MFQRYILTRPEYPVFDEKRFWMGISIGVAWSIVMYLFLQVIRSAIFFFFGYNGTVVTIINFPEYRFYSFIIALFSIIFGAYQFLEFTCFKNRTFFQSGLQKKIILFNQRNIIWNILFFSFKYLLTAFLTLLIGTVSVWKIYSSGWWISVFLSLFLYFYFWNNLKKILPNATILSLIFLPITLGLAFGLSQIKPIDMEYYQEIGLRHILHYTQKIEVPEGTNIQKISSKSHRLNFYISHAQDNVNHVKYHYGLNEISLSDVIPIIEDVTKNETHRFNYTSNIIVDKDIKMKDVYILLNRIRSTKILSLIHI